MLNMDNLNKTYEWDKIARVWSLDDILGAIAKTSYVMANYRNPKGFTDMMEKFIDSFILKSCKRIFVSGVHPFYFVETNLEELVEMIREELMDIKEFRDLNVPLDEAGHDFIDLDAFMQNVYCNLRTILIERYFFEGDVS